MSTRGDTFHILQGHVSVANTNNAVTASKVQAQGQYTYNAKTHAINKFLTQGNPKNLSQTFQVNNRSAANPLEISPLMMLRPQNRESDHAKHPLIGSRKLSTQDRTCGSSMMTQANESQQKRRNNSSALQKSGNQTIDVRSYRGNLYKQTLSPNWSKTRLREAKNKFEKITDEVRKSIERDSPSPQPQRHQADASSREAFLDTRITQGPAWRAGQRTGSGFDLEKGTAHKRSFTQTVTNFAQVRFDNNGGLNPVSPVKRGLALEQTSNTITQPGQWNRTSSTLRAARPTLDLDISEKAVSVFQPKKIISDVDMSRQVFKKYSAFKKDVDPMSSKADYKHYLDRVVQDKRHYDSNIGNSLSHQKKFLAYKNRELAQRAAALHGNAQQDYVHKAVTDQAMLKLELEKSAVVRVQPDQFNYRSPKKYTPISTYYKDLQMNRVFGMDGKMQLLRSNIR